MAVDQKRVLPQNDTHDGGNVDIDSIAPIAFAVNEKNYLLISCNDWIREQATRPVSCLGDHPVVGRIIFNGEQHVVIERTVPVCAEPEPPAQALGDLLTRREIQVALLVAEGKCDKQIARALGISGYTVREHIRRTFAKLNVSKRAAVVAHVLKNLRKPIDVLADGDP